MNDINISLLVRKKEAAFKKGTEAINELNQIISLNENIEYVKNKKYIGENVINIMHKIYNNNKFYEYLKFSFLGKHFDKEISKIKWIIILIFLCIGTLLYFILGTSLLFWILLVALIIIALIVFMKLKTGESYKSYYERTFFKFLLNQYPNTEFKFNSNNTLTNNEISPIINQKFTKKEIKNNISFNGYINNGKILDLKLINTTEYKDKNGNIRKSDNTIFNGFYVKINTTKTHNTLRGNTIKIIENENILSSMAEDTVKGIYENKKEFNFNSEEMNKSFDCKVSGYNGFIDIDEMMHTVHKIITPSFEQHLLYLRSRYNSFNMDINDTGLTATFHMDRSFFQEMKHGELLDFRKTYREANEKFKMLNADISGIEDFAYYNVFPFMERLYLINYLTYLYLSYVDSDNYYSINSSSINSFEESMSNIYIMDNKEFSEFYTDKIKKIKNETKDLAKIFKEEEIKNG